MKKGIMTQSIARKLNSFPRLLMIALVAIMMIGGAGCKSKKKAGDIADAEAEKARIEQEASERQRAEEERRRAEEERLASEKKRAAEAPAAKLSTYFQAIANSTSATSANETINEALTLFASPDVPLLIVISEYDGQKDYDRPTTIRDYLNYLKDQKKTADQIGELKFDSSGKINEIELVKKK